MCDFIQSLAIFNNYIFLKQKTGGEGIEPPTAVPKTDVLPLHQPPVLDFL